MRSKVFKTLRSKLQIIAVLDFTYEISLRIRLQLSWLSGRGHLCRGPNEFILIVFSFFFNGRFF